ncbi:alpha/beta fold hydrolase [Thermus filiformis]|uniref:Proline iminopeptidase n=1 Tax=Thermus filiformis TaxID=276 RepID=A0A0A2WQ61_THEFI|nr:alpha/beta hydrolase [Thermus filiformis]KGQ20902.1 proline iminopeptidase [Thermus filiformis]
MREEVGYIPLGEVELYVEDTGPLGAPAFLVLHDGPGGSAYALREGLSEYLEGYRVVYFDQRGSGRSLELPPDPRLFTIDALVEDVQGLAEALGLERFRLLGHGFGGIVALEAARRLEVEGVLLLGPWLSFPWLSQQLCRAAGCEPVDDPEENLARALEKADPKALFDRLMFPSLHGRLEYEWLLEGAALLDREAVGWAFVKNGLWRLDYRPYLADVSAPVEVVVGERDGTSYPLVEEAMAFLRGGLQVIPEAGHFPWIDDPEAFARAMRTALSSLVGV